MDERIESFWAERELRPWWSWWHLPELAAVFAIGLCLMNFTGAGTGGLSGGELGVAGNDSYNHVKMAVLLPEIGLPTEFRWLRHVWLTEVTTEWVNHHYGFHVLLVPFVYAGRWLRWDFLTGGRWAVATFFGVNLALFQLILMTQRVRCRWLWLALFLVMPSQFFYRHAFVRAIAPSLTFMLLIIALMFRRRCILAGVAVGAYTHLYMGGVIYGPIVVICYTVAGLIGPRGDRVSWRLGMWTLLGWLVGVRAHPYFDGMFDFLILQVFGSGLGADISVGREWKPYDDVWRLAGECAWTLIPLAGSLALRLRLGPRVNARELAVLLMSFVFAGLMLKSRRFVEYWPPFALLSAALLAGPVLGELYDRVRGWAVSAKRSLMVGAGLAALCAAAVAVVWGWGDTLRVDAVTDEWRIWALLAGGYALAPLIRRWVETRPADVSWGGYFGGLLAPVTAGAVFVSATVAVCWLASARWDSQRWRFLVPWWCFAVLGVVYVVVWALACARRPRQAAEATGKRIVGLTTLVLAGTTFVSCLLMTVGPALAARQRSARPKFDLPAIREMMAFLQENSPKDSIVFADDWDMYPVYFYFNHHNNYCVGKDPKFTQHRDPILYERFRTIARGKAPTTYEYPDDYGGDPVITRKIPIRDEDIRDYFWAKYVITDTDHMSFRRKLDRLTTFCERIYPPPAEEEPGADDGTDKKLEAAAVRGLSGVFGC